MKSVTLTEKHAWIAVGIFAAAILAYFWYKNQVAAAFSSGLQTVYDADAQIYGPPS